jgi:8-oxo-dGTP pyrophosphatase MutT (NUDIX family)
MTDSPRTIDPLLAGNSPLHPGDAAAALILVEDRGYLMQQRDARTDIWYPGFWGLFGGSVEPGEEPGEALARELYEELELEIPPNQAEFFIKLQFDLAGLGLQRYFRNYYLVSISNSTYEGLVLHEGSDMRLFVGDQILREPRVTPYDSFALFLHHARNRFDVAGERRRDGGGYACKRR